jgi:hypothetical protein
MSSGTQFYFLVISFVNDLSFLILHLSIKQTMIPIPEYEFFMAL